MKTKSFRFLITCILTSLLLCLMQQTVFAESDTATTMRLVHYEGSVEVEGPGGDPKAVMENMRFADGDALSTGLESTASVSLDTGRILTVAPSSRVAFSQQGQKLKLTLTEGELFLDVKEKLGEAETLDIQTSTMAIGIRGTIVYVSDQTNPDTAAGRTTTFGVLEGTADVSYTDTNGTAQSISVPAGERLILRDADGDGLTDAEPEATAMTAADIAGFVEEQVRKDDTILQRVEEASDILENTVDKFAADGDWTWDGPVTLIAQSASKLYDGSALTRPSDVLVYGLPSDFFIQTRAGGSQTDAGESSNPVSSYAIYNRNGDDVTGHFTGIRTVAGNLKVDPAPLTIWTGSAEKVYDGTPLTEPETQIRTVPGYEAGDPLWRDTAYVGAAARGYETLYGVCGTTWVHGTNPLTGEIREIELPAGKKMTVYLSDEDGKQSIEFRVEDMAEGEIPEDVLRLYADNPDLLAQACKDTGWDEEIIRRLIALLPEKEDEDTVEQSDLTIVRSASERLMQDSTNVRIHIDTENTSYNNRALGDKEAHFTGVHIDSSIKITATGSQTDVGQSANTYTIDWGTANPNNYILSEELGTLTVTPAALTVTTGSAQKTYDGKPLTSEEASLSGLVNGETAAITATGTITEAGSVPNTYTIDWGKTKSSNYTITEKLGTLTVTEADAPVYEDPVTLTAVSGEKTYDGTPLTASSVTVSGLPEGFTVQATATGSQTDAGSSTSSVASFTILDADGNDVTAQFVNVTAVSGTLTVTPASLTVTTNTAEKAYDGTPLTGTATVTGLVNGETVTAAAASITDAGTASNTYTIDWGTTNSANYTVTEELGTLTVTQAALTITTSSDEKVYDGTPLTGTVSSEGLASTDTVTLTATGTVTDAGTASNTYTIDWGTTNSANYTVTEELGTLTVTQAALTITTSSDEKVYDGTPLTGTVSSEGLASTDTVTLTATGTVTDAGTASNTYTIDWGTTNKDNYTVTENLGTLTVTPLPVEFDLCCSFMEGVEYSGHPIIPEGIRGTYPNTGDEVEIDEAWEYTLDDAEYYTTCTYTANLIGGAKAKITVNGYTDAGSYTIDPACTFAEGKEGNYSISYTNNTLKIEPAPLTIKASKEKVYDGTPLKSSEVFDVIGLVNGETLNTEVEEKEITNAGSETYRFTYTWGTAKESNYQFTDDSEKETGTLTVTRVPLTITPSYTSSSTTGTSFSFGGFNIAVSGADAQVVPNGNVWTQYDVPVTNGTIPVYNDGENTKWTVTLPGDTFTVQIAFYSYKEGDDEYIAITCIRVGAIDNYSVTINDLKGFKIVYPLVPDTTNEDDSDGTDDSTSLSTLSSTKKAGKAEADTNEMKDAKATDGPIETATDTNETTPADDPDKEENTDETGKPAGETVNGTDSDDGKTEQSEETAKDAAESGQKDTTAKKDAAGSEEKADTDSKTTETGPEKTTEDEDSTEKPTETNDPAGENKPETDSAADSTGEEKNAEQEKNIGQAIADAGAQAGSAIVQAVESAGAAVSPANPDTDIPETPAAVIPQGS